MKVKATGTRRIFPFRLTYFDRAGRFICHSVELWDVRAPGNKPNMEDAKEKVCRWADHYGAILLQCGEEQPCLILPK